MFGPGPLSIVFELQNRFPEPSVERPKRSDPIHVAWSRFALALEFTGRHAATLTPGRRKWYECRLADGADPVAATAATGAPLGVDEIDRGPCEKLPSCRLSSHVSHSK